MTHSFLLNIAPPLLAGLCLGGFLNVVIARLPVMLSRQWLAEAREALGVKSESCPPFNLFAPASSCPACRTQIQWYDSIPLIGWVKRWGRCATCHSRISVQFLLVELASGLLTIAVVGVFGVSWEGAFILAACLSLLALAVIDLRTYLLPDVITLPLLWAGLLFHVLFHPGALPSAVVGAMMGYGVLRGTGMVFKRITGKEGMGYGDIKLLAALGAWLGMAFVPVVLVLSAVAGTIVGLALQLNPQRRGMPMPFGHFLAAAGVASLLAGDTFMAIATPIVIG